MGKKSGPKSPDPVALANAQTDSNVKTAETQQKLNMVGSEGPGGSVTWVADPTQPGGYKQVTTLSPEQQGIYTGTMNIAQDQIGRIGDALGTSLDLDSLPGLYNPNFQKEIARGQALQYGFDPGGQIQTQVGGDLNVARNQAIDAAYGQATSRLDPRFARAEESLDVKLANQGLGANSAAAQNARDTFGREKNDAYNQAQYSAIGAGEDAAQALFQRQLGQGSFANAAQGQQYGQNAGLAEFHNAAAGQDFGQNATEAQIRNAAEAQAAQIALANRSQAFQEKAYVGNQPINQLSALLSAGQIGTPEGIGYTPSQVANTDVLGAHALSLQNQQANASRRAGIMGGAMGGLFSLGSAALMGSDRRLKENIRRVGTHPLGVGVYDFSYKGRPGTFRGVMADELKTVRPDLVVTGADGFMAVNYAGLD